MYLKISQNSQENNCPGDSFKIKLHPTGLPLYQKRDPAHMLFYEFAQQPRTTASELKFLIVYNFKIISSRGTYLTSHSELPIATKMLMYKKHVHKTCQLWADKNRENLCFSKNIRKLYKGATKL